MLLKTQELTLEELQIEKLEQLTLHQLKVMQEEQDIVQVMNHREVAVAAVLVPLVMMVDHHLVKAIKEMVVQDFRY